MKLLSLAVGLSFVWLSLGTLTVAAQSESVVPVVGVQQFVDAVASLNMFEIQSSQLVLSRSQNQKVIDLAKQAIADHTAAGGAMVAAARHEGVSPAPVVFEQHQRVLDALTSTEDVQIDQAYISAQVAAHEEAIALFEGYLLHGAEGAMKTFAGETLPVVQQHQTLTAAFLETQHGAAL